MAGKRGKRSSPKPPKRYSPKGPKPTIPDGSMVGEIKDQEILARLGKICYLWGHTEEGMILVFARLIPGGPLVDTTEVARQIYRVLPSARARIEVMRSLLKRSRHNKDKGPEYDDVLTRFSEAGTERNDYAHGLWWTHDSGKTFLEKTTADEWGHDQAEPVTVVDLDAYIKRLMELMYLIQFIL